MDEKHKTIFVSQASLSDLEYWIDTAVDIKHELIERDIEWARLLDERTRILGSYADHHDEAIKESDARKATKERDLYTRMRELRLEASTQLDEVIKQRDEWKASYDASSAAAISLQKRLDDLGYQRQIEPMLEDVIRERDELRASLDSAEYRISNLKVSLKYWENERDEAVKRRDEWKAKYEALQDEARQPYETQPKRKCAGITCGCGMGDAPCTGEPEEPTPAKAVDSQIPMGLSQVKIKLLHPELGKSIPLPERQTAGAVGYDVHAATDHVHVLHSDECVTVALGFALEVPDGYECQVRPRSGLASKRGVTIINTPGTIDRDYRGELGATLVNHGPSDVTIRPGDRIAQLVFAPVETPELVVVGELSKTERGSGGFGSTDKPVGDGHLLLGGGVKLDAKNVEAAAGRVAEGRGVRKPSPSPYDLSEVKR